MKVTIKDKEIELKYTFRSLMIYEKIMGGTFNPQGLTEIMAYFYSTIMASDKNCTISFDDFMDWVDNNPSAVAEFSQWLVEVMQRNGYINNPKGENIEETEIDPKKE